MHDAVDATLSLAASPAANGIFNVGSGVATTWKELITHLFEATGRTPQIEFVPMPERLRASYQYSTCASLTRLRTAGFTRPMTSLGDAMKDYVRYLERDARLDPAEVAP